MIQLVCRVYLTEQSLKYKKKYLCDCCLKSIFKQKPTELSSGSNTEIVKSKLHFSRNSLTNEAASLPSDPDRTFLADGFCEITFF